MFTSHVYYTHFVINNTTILYLYFYIDREVHSQNEEIGNNINEKQSKSDSKQATELIVYAFKENIKYYIFI